MPLPGGTITIRTYRPDQPINWDDLQLHPGSTEMRRFGRRSYQQIATAMYVAKGTEPVSLTATKMWENTCLSLGRMLAQDSRYFDYSQFKATCDTGDVDPLMHGV